ncbi:MAG TPA: 7TM diverse intracellular signaling domain-containing protein [Ramlibacter sp.]|nr:7TM diverse intracellular signaling domain-containing protein [Ramlibacter sp.]
MPWLIGSLGRRLLVLLATFFWLAAAQAQSGSVTPILLSERTLASLDAQARTRVWMDTSGDATIEQVQRNQARFRPGRTDDIHAFPPGGALWIHLRLATLRDEPARWLLAVPHPVLDRVVVYQQDAKGGWESQAAGDTVAVDQWPEPGRYPTFRIDLPRGQVRDVYLQVSSRTSTSVPLRLSSEAAHAQQIQIEYLFLGIPFGAMLLLIAACLAQSWAYRDSTYGWYAAYSGVTLLGVASYTGVAGHLLWSGSGFWADAMQGTLASAAGGAAALFVRNLTGISGRHRLLDRVSFIGGCAGLALALAYPALPRGPGLVVMSAYVAVASGVNVLVAWLSWRRRDPVGMWVLAAYAPLAIGVLLAVVRMAGWLPVSFATQYAIVVAIALEVPLLLVALSIRSRERHGAQIRELALSTQDALTGLLAPHLFHDRLRQVVSRYKRDGENAAVVFIDLVNHPRIKSYYGSAVAEQSLLRCVIKLRRLLRDVDTVSRIGENRFGLIIEGSATRIGVMDRAARLIAAGLIPLNGLKPDVTLQFHVAAVLLEERVMEPQELVDALDSLLGIMSSRTRRPIRFLVPDVTQPAALDSLTAPDEDSQLTNAEAAMVIEAARKASRP